MTNPITLTATGVQLAVFSKKATRTQRVIIARGPTAHIVVVTGVTADPYEVLPGDWGIYHESLNPQTGKWEPGNGRLKSPQHAQFEDGLDNDYDDLEVIFVDRLSDLPKTHPAYAPEDPRR